MSAAERTLELLERLRTDNGESLGQLFELHRNRLWRMVYVRLERRVARRISPDDVLQEAFLDVAARIGEYLDNPTVPFYVWLRFLTLQRLHMIHRAHLGARMRSVSQEAALSFQGAPASAESMAGQLVSHLTSPSQAAIRHELQEQLHGALAAMDPLDREVLALRHFEELGNNETAAILGISKDAASKRHVRALVRLREILSEASDLFPT